MCSMLNRDVRLVAAMERARKFEKMLDRKRLRSQNVKNSRKKSVLRE